MYWETLHNKKKPKYIDICTESVKFNCNKCFNIKILDNKSINDYISDEITNIDLSNLLLPQKVDYYRYCLLNKYGGVWLDSDILVLKCICKYYKKLNNTYDYIGFGCGFDKKTCKKTMNGYTKPLNWFMISKPQTPFIKCVKDTSTEIIKNTSGKLPYHKLGKVILEKCYKKTKDENIDKKWDYLHIPSKCQEYDSIGNKLNNININFNTEDCKEDRFFFPLYNTSPGYPEFFKNLTKEEIIEQYPTLGLIIKYAFSKKISCI